MALTLSVPFRFGLLSALCVGFSGLLSAACPSDTPTPGCVRYIVYANPSFDQYTKNPSSSQVSWMQNHFWRIRSYSPYFDNRLSWFPDAQMYMDVYGIHIDDPLVSQHPDWILRDSKGNKLYIPWDCADGKCTQYAFDTSNQSFRDWWITSAKSDMANGYRGIWLDDVNIIMRTSDGSGKFVNPIDPNTGELMTQDAWENYMSSFMQYIRSSFPNAEIVHNSIWFAGSRPAGSDKYVQREILAADYVNFERGFSDTGITGGTGNWSMSALMTFIDLVHGLGRPIVVQPYTVNGDYDLAGYFLMWQPGDALSTDSVTPDNWPKSYDVQIGTPLGERYSWQGLLRRDYSNGMALMNVPDSPTITVTPPGNFINSSGKSVTTVTLDAGEGAVLVGSGIVQSSVVSINAGGNSSSNFVADTDFSGGVIDTSSADVDLSGVKNPAPVEVYQSRRLVTTGDTQFTYTIPRLTPGASYDVRLHFSDPWAKKTGDRYFDIFLNSWKVFNDFDIYSLAGAQNKAVIMRYSTNADDNGNIVVQFKNNSSSQGRAMVNGIEVVPN